ncbi:MAG: hypothetical protein R3F20_07865 [Planctomycetota bacterium]
MRNFALAFAAIALFAVGANAQLALNEIYVSHAGADDMEMIEIIGTPGASLQDVFIGVVEGDAGSSTGSGQLDILIDLSGNVIPADGYFVVGTGNSLEPNADIVISAAVENGTDTFYLILAQNPAGLMALAGTDVRDPMDPTMTTTVLNQYGLILDSVGLTDGGSFTDPVTMMTVNDQVYDAAFTVGPDGTFLPAGIFRDGDFPNGWNTTMFLDFDDVVNANSPRTPGAMNTCTTCVPPTYPGNTGDVAIDVLINGTADFQQTGIHSIAGTDNFELRMLSPGGTLDNVGFSLVATIFPTGMLPGGLPLLPSSGGTINLDAWVSLASAQVLLDGFAQSSFFSPRLTPGGFAYGPFASSPSFAGNSALVQAFVSVGGFGTFQAASSDAHELIFGM